MKTEQDIRRALHDAAAKHQINPTLDLSIVARARVSRALAALGIGVVALALVLAAVGAVALLRGSEERIPPADSREYGTETKRTAPLLLITAEGWSVTRADEYGVKSGEITFKNGKQEIDLFWRPAKTHDDYVRDRAASGPELEPMTIAGKEAVVFQTEGTTAFQAMWLEGPLSLELSGGAESEAAFRKLAASLQFVDEETWLAAMPDDTITPEQRADAVDEMLADIPVHPDVDIQELKAQHTVSDRYQLGAQVTGAVACAWIEQWIEAKQKDNDAAREAEQAMATSHEWDILKEMKSQGGWSGVLWNHADAMTNDGQVPAGEAIDVEASYRSALGCEDTGG